MHLTGFAKQWRLQPVMGHRLLSLIARVTLRAAEAKVKRLQIASNEAYKLADQAAAALLEAHTAKFNQTEGLGCWVKGSSAQDPEGVPDGPNGTDPQGAQLERDDVCSGDCESAPAC